MDNSPEAANYKFCKKCRQYSFCVKRKIMLRSQIVSGNPEYVSVPERKRSAHSLGPASRRNLTSINRAATDRA
jgi:hypothetical protein